jgi:hypothetical protein
MAKIAHGRNGAQSGAQPPEEYARLRSLAEKIWLDVEDRGQFFSELTTSIAGAKVFRFEDALNFNFIPDSTDIANFVIDVKCENSIDGPAKPVVWFHPLQTFDPTIARYFSPIRISNSCVDSVCEELVSNRSSEPYFDFPAKKLLFEDCQKIVRIWRNYRNIQNIVIPLTPSGSTRTSDLIRLARSGDWFLHATFLNLVRMVTNNA